ncbi:MAG: tRNA pseudouridine(38-40) synthase TruA [Synergistaceae bacterium]|nr:tRNA pseudouridine(38-40) synthase TruA [Synergistaceae bacterium]
MRYALEVAYDGRPFSGWQKQPGRKTVQGTLEDALSRLDGSRVRVVGAGRTDAGVHARGQVASFDLSTSWEIKRLLRAVENNVPPEIGIVRAAAVPGGFHARHSAIWREYAYFLWTASYCYPHVRPFVWRVRSSWDSPELVQACKALEGEHDFAFFCPQSERPPDSVRRVLRAELVRRKNWVAFRIRATGFLFHMVRNIVEDLNRIAEGKLSLEAFRQNLTGKVEQNPRFGMAPSSGLFLWKIGYSPSPWE